MKTTVSQIMKDTEIQLLEIALKKITEALDNLISAGLSDTGITCKDISKARSYLPKGYKNSYKKEGD